MNICVIGGGNMGTTLAADLVRLHPDYSIRLLTSKPELFQKTIEVNDIENHSHFVVSLPVISSSPVETVADADVIFITHPSFLIEHTFAQIKAYVKKGAYVGVIPGFGGCEFYWNNYFDDSVTLFGYQRVPYIVRMEEYGKCSNLTSRKSQLIVGVFHHPNVDEVCSFLTKLLDVPCRAVPNYLAITLTPSNPLLHTARIYDLFKDIQPSDICSRNPKFYAEWTERASQILFSMDEEVQMLCQAISGLDLKEVESLKVHYESADSLQLTQKMRSIESLKNILSPMLHVEGGYLPDLSSRYFIEDFPFGLCIIKGFCDIYHIDTPSIDEVLMWYEKFAGVEYFVNREFTGKDLVNTAIPQNFGITTPEEVLAFYGGARGACPPPTSNVQTISIQWFLDSTCYPEASV